MRAPSFRASRGEEGESKKSRLAKFPIASAACMALTNTWNRSCLQGKVKQISESFAYLFLEKNCFCPQTCWTLPQGGVQYSLEGVKGSLHTTAPLKDQMWAWDPAELQEAVALWCMNCSSCILQTKPQGSSAESRPRSLTWNHLSSYHTITFFAILRALKQKAPFNFHCAGVGQAGFWSGYYYMVLSVKWKHGNGACRGWRASAGMVSFLWVLSGHTEDSNCLWTVSDKCDVCVGCPPRSVRCKSKPLTGDWNSFRNLMHNSRWCSRSQLFLRHLLKPTEWTEVIFIVPG